MKKLLFSVPMLALMLMASCGNNAAQKAEQMRLDSIARADSIAKADSIARIDSINKVEAEKAVIETGAIAFVTEFYNKRKFEDESFLKKNCSAEVLKKLRADNDYDDGGLATWDFRSDAQDGPSERHEIIKVEPLGDDWYQYEFYDMGIKGSHKIKLTPKDGSYLIDGLK